MPTRPPAVAATFLLSVWAALPYGREAQAAQDQPPPEVGAATDGGAADTRTDATEAPPTTIPPLPATSRPAPETAEAAFDLVGKIDDIADLDLEALLQNTIVTATKSQIKEDEAPAITTVISREEIRRWGYRSVDEALRHVAGVYVIDDHVVPNVAVRGVSGGLRSESGLIKVMIDGHSVAFRATSGNWLGPNLIPLSAVQQIEIIRGPASALYGADAFLGVINIVTRAPGEMKGGELGVVTNSTGITYRFGQDAALGGTAGRLRVLAAYRTYSEDRSGLQLPAQSPAPHVLSYSSPDGRARDLVQDSNVAFLKASYQASASVLLSIAGYYSRLDRGAEFADWAQLTHGLDSSGRTNGTTISLQQGLIDARADIALGRDLDLVIDSLTFAGGPTSRDRIEVGSDTYYVKRDFGYRGMDAGVEAHWRARPELSVLAGLGYLIDEEELTTAQSILKTTIDTTAAGDVQTSRAGALDRIRFTSPAAHAQVMWSPFGPRLSIAAGARYDYHNVYGGQWSARLGGVLAVAKSVHVKLLYGSAFKAPSPELLYGFPLATEDILGNPHLKPSRIHTLEALLSYRPGKYVFVSTGVAGNDLVDQAEFAQQGDNQVAGNIAKTYALSWESELRLDYRKLLLAYANLAVNYTVEKTEQRGYLADLTDHSNLTYPKVVANAGASAKLAQWPLRMGVEASYASARRASRSNILDHGGLYDYPQYIVLGANVQSVGLALLDGHETILRATVRNMFDASIADPGFAGVDYPQLGRTITVDLVQEW